MVSRSVLIGLLLAVAAASTAATVLIANSRNTGIPEEQRAVLENFFGSDKELPQIKEGQEMRPRW